MDNYDELLKRAYDSLPDLDHSGERFEVPEAVIFQQGNRTIIKNFKEICDAIRRDPNVFGKYLSRELAAPYAIEDRRLVLNGRLDARLIKSKIKDFIEKYVKCPVCGRYDTNLEMVDRHVRMLRCEVCGARTPVRL